MESRSDVEAGAEVTPVFSEGDYRAIREYEDGAEAWTPVVEQAYLNLCAALALELEPPAAIPASWWEAMRLEWEYPLEMVIEPLPAQILVE